MSSHPVYIESEVFPYGNIQRLEELFSQWEGMIFGLELGFGASHSLTGAGFHPQALTQ